MKQKVIVFSIISAILLSLLLLLVLFISKYNHSENIVFNPQESIEEFGSISNNIDIKQTNINYTEYYWDETTFENAKNKFLSLAFYYGTIKKSGKVNDGDGLYAKINVFDSEKILYQDIVEIYKDTNEFYSSYYPELIGKEIDSTQMFDFLYSKNSTFEKQDWMVESSPCYVSITLIGRLEKTIPTLNEENLSLYIVPKMEETLNQNIDIKTIEDFNMFIENELDTQVQEKNNGNVRNAIFDFIETKTQDVEVNEEFSLEYANKVILPYFEKDAKNLNMSIEDYALEYWGKEKTSYLKEVGIYEMKKNVVLMNIAKQANINITKEDVNNYISKYYNIYAEINGTTIEEESKRIEDFPYSFYFMYLQEKVINYIQENANIVKEQVSF